MTMMAGNSASPADEAVVVTPSDSTVFTQPSRGVFVGTVGDLTVDMKAVGTNITFKNIPSGTLLPFRVTRVYATATSATNIVLVR